MTRTELDKYITDYYGGSAEYLWASAPSFAVYRHCENNKWFAVIMDMIEVNALCWAFDSLV